MTRLPPLVIDLPPMSDRSAFELHRCLNALIEAFESRHELQIWRYYDQHPEHERPARFDGEPF